MYIDVVHIQTIVRQCMYDIYIYTYTYIHIHMYTYVFLNVCVYIDRRLLCGMDELQI